MSDTALTEDRSTNQPVSKKRGRSAVPRIDPSIVPILLGHLQQLPGCTALLTKDGDLSTAQQAASRSLQEQPPWTHWSKTDQATQHFRYTGTHKLGLTTALRGYRMARATHGVSQPGNFYFEVILHDGPTAQEILKRLPYNARLGSGLSEQLLRPKEEVTPVGGHWRIGWSMRTGDLQAAVGYDKWSYGIRTLHSSLVHDSQRQDDWHDESFRSGDVLGCLLHWPESENSNDTRYVRFFRNGKALGDASMVRGKLQGGLAFSDLSHGVYYPAVSGYMGANCTGNFGPHFVCPPRGEQVQPLPCPPPPSVEHVLGRLDPTLQTLPSEQRNMIQEAVQVEVGMLHESYRHFMEEHVKKVRHERQERGLDVDDLPMESNKNEQKEETEEGASR